jgi:hypothetical protein
MSAEPVLQELVRSRISLAHCIRGAGPRWWTRKVRPLMISAVDACQPRCQAPRAERRGICGGLQRPAFVEAEAIIHSPIDRGIYYLARIPQPVRSRHMRLCAHPLPSTALSIQRGVPFRPKRRSSLLPSTSEHLHVAFFPRGDTGLTPALPLSWLKTVPHRGRRQHVNPWHFVSRARMIAQNGPRRLYGRASD